MFGLTSSATTFTLGPTGPVGRVGPIGSPGPHLDEKLVTIFCKKDYGFIKSGEYLNVFIYKYKSVDLKIYLTIRSEDNKMNFYFNETEADEYFYLEI